MSNWIKTTSSVDQLAVLVNLDDVQSIEECQHGTDVNKKGCALTMMSGMVLAVDEDFEAFGEKLLRQSHTEEVKSVFAEGSLL